MTIYINNRNLLTWPREMARILSAQGHDVIFIDVASTWEPLLDWYETCDYKVIKSKNNHGKHTPWVILGEKMPPSYIVTDPDLDISEIPSDWPEVLEEAFTVEKDTIKTGFHLREDKMPSMNPSWWMEEIEKYPAGDHPDRWSTRLAKRGDRCDFYKLGVDTTFALYKKPAWQGTTPAIRTGLPYAARHLPHHIVSRPSPGEPSLQIPIDDEIYHYFTTAKNGGMRHRMLPLMEEWADGD